MPCGRGAIAQLRNSLGIVCWIHFEWKSFVRVEIAIKNDFLPDGKNKLLRCDRDWLQTCIIYLGLSMMWAVLLPMFGAGSSSGVELFQVFMGRGLWQDGADQQMFHCLFIPTFARCLSILVESPCLHKGFASSSPFRWRFRLAQVGHATLEPGGSDYLGLNESLYSVIWSVFECRRSRQGVQHWALMTMYRMKMTIIQYRLCWDNLTVTSRHRGSLWGLIAYMTLQLQDCIVAQIPPLMLLILSIRICCIKYQIMY